MVMETELPDMNGESALPITQTIVSPWSAPTAMVALAGSAVEPILATTHVPVILEPCGVMEVTENDII